MTLPQKWRILSFKQEQVKELQRRHNFTKYFSKVLLDRGIRTDEEIKKLLSPRIETLHQPNLLPDIRKGSERIKKALDNKEKVLVWGDEDTDGTTATLLLFELFRMLDIQVAYHIPSRENEGIGLNVAGIKKSAEMGCSVIVTVDCGSANSEEIRQANKLGIDVIVTDHHEVNIDEKPDFPLINPKRNDSRYPFRDIAGVTVAFKFACYIANELHLMNSKEFKNTIKGWYPLLFLGTYADKVPLKDENLTLAKLGFESLTRSKRTGIRILVERFCKENVCTEPLVHKMISVLSTAKTKGWRENIGFRILTENDEHYLGKMIPQLIKQSENWHLKARKTYRQISSSIDSSTKNSVIFIYEPKASFKYLGFCASRLKEKFNRPVIIATDKDNRISGEARSPRMFDVYNLLSKQKKLFLSFGGHKPACGFTMEKKNLDRLKKFLAQNSHSISIESEVRKELRIISTLPLGTITKKIKKESRLLSPFGSGNPPPFFIARNVSITDGIYTYIVPDTGESKRIEMKNDFQNWVGIDGKSVILDIVYYISSAGMPTIIDTRPSLFNEPLEQT